MPACRHGNTLDLLPCHFVFLSLAVSRTSKKGGSPAEQASAAARAKTRSRQHRSVSSAHHGGPCAALSAALQQDRPCMASALQAGRLLGIWTWHKALAIIATSTLQV